MEIYKICQYLPNNFLRIDNQKVELQFFKDFPKKYYVFNYNEISLIKSCFIDKSNSNGGKNKFFYLSIFKDLEVVNIPSSIWQNYNRVEKIFQNLYSRISRSVPNACGTDGNDKSRRSSGNYAKMAKKLQIKIVNYQKYDY